LATALAPPAQAQDTRQTPVYMDNQDYGPRYGYLPQPGRGAAPYRGAVPQSEGAQALAPPWDDYWYTQGPPHPYQRGAPWTVERGPYPQPYGQQYLGPRGYGAGQGQGQGQGQGYGYSSGAGGGPQGMGPHAGSYYGMHHGTAPGAFPQANPQYGPQYGQPYTPQQGLQYRQGSGVLQPGWAGVFQIVDRDGDGLIQPDEAASRHEARFEMLDTDGDGALTESEFVEGPRGGALLREGQAMGTAPAASRAMQARRAESRQRRETRFQEMDADEDGNLSRSEFMTAGEQRFAAADLDNDGTVTVWEFRAQRRD
jgi:Ca2+-binding EF-hand superfamily protein